MMKFATIENGKITDVVSGVKPEGYTEVIQQWSLPTAYPDIFYVVKTTQPQLTVVGDVVHENWEFLLKPVSLLKEEIMERQKQMRKLKQLGTFDFGGVPILLADNEDSLLIQSLDEAPLRFKIAGGIQRVEMTAAEVVLFKQAHRAHVQVAYDWEEGENIKVDGMTTHEELVAYLLLLDQEV